MPIRRTAIGAALFIVIALAGYVLAGPYMTLSGIREAVDNRDAEALSRYVDFHSVQWSLTTQLNGMLVRTATLQSEDNPFMALGVAAARLMMEPMIQAWVSPEGMAAMFSGAKPDEPTAAGEKRPRFQLPENASYRFEGWDRYVVTIPSPDDSTEPVQLILRRQALSWKLSEIKLPADLLAPTARKQE